MSRPKVIVTRPAEEAERLVPAIQSLGGEAVLAPMLEIRLHRPEPIPLDGVQAILITSANGARALVACLAAGEGRDLPMLAVGEASAMAARDLGFRRIAAAGGDVAALVALTRSRCRPEAGRLLHAAGSVVAGDLKGALEAAGFAVERRVLYDAVPIASLGDAAIAAVNDAECRAVLFFSPRTAETFVTLVKHAALERPVGRLDAICLSEAVARVARGLPWRHVIAAERPEQAALIDALAAVLAGSGHDRSDFTER